MSFLFWFFKKYAASFSDLKLIRKQGKWQCVEMIDTRTQHTSLFAFRFDQPNMSHVYLTFPSNFKCNVFCLFVCFGGRIFLCMAQNLIFTELEPLGNGLSWSGSAAYTPFGLGQMRKEPIVPSMFWWDSQGTWVATHRAPDLQGLVRDACSSHF